MNKNTKEALPSIKECYSLMDEYKLPINVRNHCEAATKAAVFIARKLIGKGEKIDLELLRKAALLHDIAKPIEFRDYTPKRENNHYKATSDEIKKWEELREEYKGLDHETAAKKILKDYPVLGELISHHRYDNLIKGLVDTWEKKILYYVDKIVMLDKIVTLQERVEDGHKRYNDVFEANPEYIKKIDKLIFELQDEIFKKADVNQSDLISLNQQSIKGFLYD
ncbi:HDIG domain-containing protein [Candidatus Woesearchaeota archaeon]|nr:HDIG domain-containing protein [Candidatus Woesearchaeota archaeon]